MTNEKIKKAELEAIYDSKQSFYEKAKVELEGNRIVLYSYGSYVAYIENDIAYITGDYTQTTFRHIKEFLLQNGFEAVSKKQMMEDYGL